MFGSAVLMAARSAQATPCSQEVVNRVKAPIADGAPSRDHRVYLDCDLTLAPTDRIEKRLVFEGAAATGLTLDCNGATLDGGPGTKNAGQDMIKIQSTITPGATEADATFTRPSDITIRDCNIIGSMRILGMGPNGEAPHVRESSRRDAGHVARARAAAPTRITLDNLSITGTGRNPLYLAPGVTFVSLINSEIKGRSTRTGMYLDAESAYNTIRNNYLHVDVEDDYVGGLYVRRGPQINIDGSSHNKILDNRFSALQGGGIYTYRNCGEGGTIRHSTPSYNTIVNNTFYYNRYDGDNPSVLLGSRGDEWWRFYCDDDEGGTYTGGSRADNRSFSRFNLVMQNQIYKLSTNKMIRQGDSSNTNNIIRYNTTVTAETVQTRLAGCYIAGGYKDLLLHGQSLDVFKGANGLPVCSSLRASCNDGTTAWSSVSGCRIRQMPFSYAISGDNAGRVGVPSCPIGTRIVSVRAGCNLESGSVTDRELQSVPGHTLKVFRESDNRSDGSCFVDDTRISYGDADIVRDVLDRRGVRVGCKERDSNGGDCQIRGILYCR